MHRRSAVVVTRVTKHTTRESEAAERSLAATDGLISIINKQVEDALLPLLSVLRGVEEDEHKHREKLLAIEKRKLALKNEKFQLFARHGAPSWNSPISQPQVGLANFMGNTASAPEPVKDGTEEKGVSSRRSSGSDGFLQPSKLGETDVTKYKTPDDEDLPIANKLVAFPDDSNEGDHSVERKGRSSEGDHSHSDKNLPKLDKVVACLNVRSCLSDDSNEGVHSDEFKDQTEGDPRHSDKNLPNLDKVVACSIDKSYLSDDSNARDRSDELKDHFSEGDHSHSVDLPKLDKVETRGDLGHFREDWMKTEKLVSGDSCGPPKIVVKDETQDAKCVSLFGRTHSVAVARLFGRTLSVAVVRSCSPGRTSEADNFRPGIRENLVEYGALNAKSRTLSEEGELKECELSLGNYKNLPLPDQDVVACPHCGSNKNQPRRFCKSCYRNWTPLSMEIWRKKNKAVEGLHLTASQESLMLRGPTPSPESASFSKLHSCPWPRNGRERVRRKVTEPSAEKSYEYTHASRLLQPWNEKHLLCSSQGGAFLSTPLLNSDRPAVKPRGLFVSSVKQQHQPVSVLGKRGAADGGRQEDAQLPAKALRGGSVSCKSEIVTPTLKPELELARACEP